MVVIFDGFWIEGGNVNGLGGIIYSGIIFFRIFGGGMLNNSFSLFMVINSIFFGNIVNVGGGMYNFSFSLFVVINSIFYGNMSVGGEMYNNSFSLFVVINCIIWGSGSGIVNNNSILIVIFFIVQGGYVGMGNFSQDLFFIDVVNDDLCLQACFLGIDVGDNNVVFMGIIIDLDGNLCIFNNGIVDMGVYEL